MANEKRLLSVDNAISHYKALANIEWNKKVSPVSWADAYEEFIEYLEEAPTVDAVEVVHAKWAVSRESKISKSVWCTACGEDFYLHKKNTVPIDKMPYCPNCGAKMDGGNEDANTD